MLPVKLVRPCIAVSPFTRERTRMTFAAHQCMYAKPGALEAIPSTRRWGGDCSNLPRIHCKSRCKGGPTAVRNELSGILLYAVASLGFARLELASVKANRLLAWRVPEVALQREDDAADGRNARIGDHFADSLARGQINPKRSYRSASQRSARRQERPFPKQPRNASVRPERAAARD